jgi:NAD(P)-dependent dehydrogenase (short-subunit alcohol dehydrogenase family)
VSKYQYFVTGASSGIGYAVTKTLLEQGMSVIGIGTDPSKVSIFKNQYNEELFKFFSYDLNDLDGIEIFFSEFDFQFDGLVLCAGKEESIPLAMYKPDKILSIFQLNVLANIELIRVFSKKKYSKEGSSIVVVASAMAELGEVGKVGYCSTKASLLGLVRSSALELIKRKIRVNAVSPAIVRTPLTDKMFSSLTEEQIMEIMKMHPGGIGSVEDVVPAIIFLLSDGARWITGQNLNIDGGYSIK